MIEKLVSVLTDEQFVPEHPLLIAFRSIWLRLSHVRLRPFAFFYETLTNNAGVLQRWLIYSSPSPRIETKNSCTEPICCIDGGVLRGSYAAGKSAIKRWLDFDGGSAARFATWFNRYNTHIRVDWVSHLFPYRWQMWFNSDEIVGMPMDLTCRTRWSNTRVFEKSKSLLRTLFWCEAPIYSTIQNLCW